MIGKRYQEEKKEQARPKIENEGATVAPLKTADKIAEQNNIAPRTVKNAEKFANAIDTIAENVGINPQKILSGEINASRRDIQEVSKYEPAFQKWVFEKVENKELKNIKDAVKEVKKERM